MNVFPLLAATSDWQTPAAGLVVAAALGYLTRGWWWPRRKTAAKPGCGSGCGCSVAPKPGLPKPRV